MVNLQLMNLPGCSPDFNAGGVSWGWAREEATGKPWLGNKEAVTEKVGGFLSSPANRKRRGPAPLPDGAAIKG